ncbi:MAG TPA: polysaccharide deacetylase family protein [Solirubrobacterales bacterium]|nr:polysaccharide deacetylase family protein [Solirubrobacterales bacterium]
MESGAKGTARSRVRMRQNLALLAFFMLIAGLAVMVPSNATSADQNPIRGAELSQKGRSLVFHGRGSPPGNMGKLGRRPDFIRGNQRYTCLLMNRKGRSSVVRICLGGSDRTYRALGVSRTSASGKVRSSKVIRAEVKKVNDLQIVATFDPRDAGLPPGRYAWRVVNHSGGCPSGGPTAKPSEDCLSQYPPKRRAVYGLRPVVAVGCTGGNGEFVTHGPRGRKRVALTFDDGPSDYTPAILRILARRNAKATFFMLGQQVASNPRSARRVLALGHEVANHSYDHDQLPSGSNIRRSTRRIRQVTGFRPCLFRPPYGAVSSTLKQSVRANRMKTVNWDVDTSDWKLPGAASISSTIVHRVRPGSIVLMHDGGGPRSGTVAALDSAITGLRRRGYRLVTVSELLGNRVIYRPAR